MAEEIDFIDEEADEPTVSVVSIRGAIGDTIIAGRDTTYFVGGQVIGPDVVVKGGAALPVISEEQAFERIGAAVRLNLQQLERNIEQARRESSQFFRLTLLFSGLGFAIILGGIALLLAQQVAAGAVTAAASIIPEMITILFLNKDKELRKTIEAYHRHMLDSQQILTMIDVAETIKDHVDRDNIKQQIIRNVLGIK